MADQAGYLADLKRDGTVIAGVKDLTPPNVEAETIDRTDFDSTQGYREYIMGLIDAGEVSLTVNYDPAETTQDDLLSDLNSRTKQTYALVWPDGTTWEFDAFVTGFSPAGIAVDGGVDADFTLKLTGQPAFISGS